MSGPFNLPPRTRRPSINITPLIDVMFLLLIFFMVSSTFKEFAGIDVALPKAANASPQQAEVHEIMVDAEGKWYLDGEPTDAPGLERRLQALIEAESEATFILRADTDAAFGAVLRAIDVAKKVGGERLIIPTDFLDPPEAPLQP